MQADKNIIESLEKLVAWADGVSKEATRIKKLLSGDKKKKEHPYQSGAIEAVNRRNRYIAKQTSK